MKMKFDRWPWQGPRPVTPLGGNSRFGGGWQYKFGFQCSTFKFPFTMIIDLLIGSIRITIGEAK